MKSDLQLHSNYSDGSFSPTEVMQRCKDCGVEVVSLTDHENVGGITEAEEARDKLGIRVIPGIELSSDFQGGEHHILGYFIDPNDQKLKEFLETWKASKIDQIKEIIGNLQKFGFEVSSEKVINSAKGSLDRYHIVKAIFPDHEKSTEAKEEQSRFFRKFLMEKFHGGEGLAFVEREKPDIQSVINVIHDVGGMAFWAHPFWKIRDESVIRGLAKIFDKVGIDGIEVLYPYHNKEQADLLHKIARDFSLYESAGSDFHRKDDSVRQIAGFHDFGIEINFPFYEGGNT